MEVEYRWNMIQIKVGDSQTHVLRDDQPLSVLAESQDFDEKVFDGLTTKYRDTALKKLLEDLITKGSGSNCFGSLLAPVLQLISYLDFLCERAKADGILTSGMKTKIEKMIQKLVYYLEPFVIIFADPGTDKQRTFSELAAKSKEIYQELIELQALVSLDSLAELVPLLGWDWNGILTQLMDANWEYYLDQVNRVLTSNDPTILELTSRLFSDRSTPILDLMMNIAFSLKQATDSHSKLSEYELYDFNTKYQLWLRKEANSEPECHELVICKTPQKFSQNSTFDTSQPFKIIKLGFSQRIE